MIWSIQASRNTPSFYSSNTIAHLSLSPPAPARDVAKGKEWLFSSPGPCCSFEAVTVKSDVTQLESLRYRPLPLQLPPSPDCIVVRFGGGESLPVSGEVLCGLLNHHYHGVGIQIQIQIQTNGLV